MTEPTELLPCPFCGAGESQIHVNKGTWNGRGYGEPVSVEVRHWCADVPGQPSRMISRAGRDEASAIAAWNTRAKWGSPVVAGEPQPSTEGPPEVWLQLHGDCAEPELSEPVDYTAGDVTWCWHSIHDSDVRYVRADLATTPQPTQAQAGPTSTTTQPAPNAGRQAQAQTPSSAAPRGRSSGAPINRRVIRRISPGCGSDREERNHDGHKLLPAPRCARCAEQSAA